MKTNLKIIALITMGLTSAATRMDMSILGATQAIRTRRARITVTAINQ